MSVPTLQGPGIGRERRHCEAAAAIDRTRILLPETRVDFLRITRIDTGPAPRISGAVAEVVQPAAEAARTEISKCP